MSSLPFRRLPQCANLFSRRHAPLFAAAAFVTILFSASGAYNTADLALPHRLALWALVCLLVIGQVSGLKALIYIVLRRGLARRSLLSAVLALVTTTVLLAGELHALKYTRLLPKSPDPFPQFVLFCAPLVVGLGGLTLVMSHRPRRPENQIANGDKPIVGDAANSAAVNAPTLEELIAEEVVNFVRSDGHYLDIGTDTAQHFVRGRMKDAVRLLANKPGLHVHRSWWVSLDFVASTKRSGRDYLLRLKDGCEVPVSRGKTRTLLGKLEGMSHQSS